MSHRLTRFATCLALPIALALAPGCGGDGMAPPVLPDLGTDDAYIPACGNKIPDPGEQCDDGNMTPGDGCERDCSWTCVTDPKCDDGDACNGAETCTAGHVCKPGTPLADGAACGMSKICKKGVCGDVSCGDQIVSAGEECDDGNIMNGDGCDSCRFTCIAGDPMRACTSGDLCTATATCTPMHTCVSGMPLPDGSACGMGLICKAGMCVANPCGNSMADPGEQCDDGNQVPGDGCEPTCKFTCGDPVADCKQAAPACQKWTCNVRHLCEAAADVAKEGQACAMGLVCKMGVCTSPNAMCGNGVKDIGEDCDFGMQNGAGTGCERTCKFSCVKMPDSCVDMNPCNGTEACVNVTVNNQTGQKCMAGMNAMNGTACGMGSICLMGACKISMCGDAFVDMGKGEQCEPPNTMVCDAMCKSPSVCGNGKREGAEQCDDGNKVNLDGCNASCKFEQDHRVNYLKMQFNTDMYCTANAFGQAVVFGTAQMQLQDSIDAGILDGSITMLFQSLGMTDLTGTNEPMFNLGVLAGGVLNPAMAMYNGTADLDWWYRVDPMTVDMARLPLSSLPAKIAAKVLDAGPGTVAMNISINGAPAALKLTSAKMNGTVGAATAPKIAMNMLPPGHLPAENLDPMLLTYQSVGQQNANGSAKLCGNVAASSLAAVKLPKAITDICNQYTMNNSMLDLVVGGCTAFGFITVIRATQPDRDDPNVMPVGAGPAYRLSATANRILDTCRDKNNAIVNFQQCLSDAAYSSFFKLATGRVIVK